MSEWQPISTAPKGGGAELITDSAYVDPPRVLLGFASGAVSVGYWEPYYAEGGMGFTGRLAWVEPISGEPVSQHYGPPTHWMPLPPPPVSGLESSSEHPAKHEQSQ